MFFFVQPGHQSWKTRNGKWYEHA